VPHGGACPIRFSPDEPTLHKGDYIVFKAVDAEELNTDYPNSDIIVYHKPTNPDELIVSRIVAKEERDGVLYFSTKGDGNGMTKWPDIPLKSDYDPWGVNWELLKI